MTIDKIEEIKFETKTETTKKNDKQVVLDNRIKVGVMSNKNNKSTIITIPENSRKGNTLILGSKLSGKSTYILPYLAKQDIQRKNAGCTFIVSKKDLAYTLYAIAKMESKKKVHLIKPSCDVTLANKLLWDTNDYDYDEIKEVIDFKEVIKKKEIVIIDMENSRYHQGAVRAVAKLLIQLQTDMQDVASTIKRDHFVYIDDAQFYLPFIDTLLNHGDDYNMSTTLFMQGRNQFKIYGEDYTSLMDNNVRNYILMNGINFDDAQYFAPMFGVSHNDFLQRKTGSISIAHVDQHGSMKFIPSCEVLKISRNEMEKIEARAKKERKKFVKESNATERKIPLSIEEKKGFSVLVFEDEKKNVSIVERKAKEVVEETKQESMVQEVVQDVVKTIQETDAIEINLMDNEEPMLPDLGIEEETFVSEFEMEIDIEEPDFGLETIDDSLLEVEVENTEVSEETFEEMAINETVEDDEDEEVILMSKPSMVSDENIYHETPRKQTFAPRRRSEIERECVKDFYDAILGNKLGGSRF